MEFIVNSYSKPVITREAEKIIKALKNGGHVANDTALETIARIAKRHIGSPPPNLPAR